MHRGDASFRDQLLPLECPLIQLEKHPVRHLHDIAVNRACRTDHIKIAVSGRLHLIILIYIWHSGIRMTFHLVNGEVAVIHSQRRENPLLHPLLPRNSCKLSHEIPRSHIHQIVVLPLGAEIVVRLQILQPLDDFLPRERRIVPHEIMPRKSGAVTQHIPDRYSFRREAII